MIKVIKISKKPKFIIVTHFENEIINYWIDKKDTINKNCDIGIWKIKYN